MQGLYLAMYGDKVELGQALFISIFAMAVVFLVLLIISYLIDFTALCLKGNKTKKKTENATEVKPDVQVARKSSDDSLVVVIASYLGTSVDNVKITKIRRITQTGTAWSERGLLSQIKP